MTNSRLFPYVMWLLPLSFFTYQFILRVSPGVFMHDIMQKFHIDALSFGVLSGFYYLGYAGMQIPVGLMLDKFSPRLVIATSIITCSLGAFLFATTSNWQMVLLARFLIGAGSAVAFLGTAKVIRTCFRSEQYSMMVGFTFTIGLLGAIYGGKPLTILTQKLGWEKVMLMLAAIAFSIGLLVFILMRLTKEEQTESEGTPISEQLLAMLKRPKLLFIAFCGGLMVGPLEGFADVWGIPYLTQIYGIDKATSSFIVSSIFFGMCFGGPLLSFFSEKFNAHYLITSFCALVMASLFFVLIYFNHLDYKLLLGLFFFMGILCCYQVVIFTIVSEMVPSNLIGIATAITNSINMAFGFFFHIAIGYIMEQNWAGETLNGIKLYDKQAFTYALSVIPAAALVGFLGFLLVKSSSKAKELQLN